MQDSRYGENRARELWLLRVMDTAAFRAAVPALKVLLSRREAVHEHLKEAVVSKDTLLACERALAVGGTRDLQALHARKPPQTGVPIGKQGSRQQVGPSGKEGIARRGGPRTQMGGAGRKTGARVAPGAARRRGASGTAGCRPANRGSLRKTGVGLQIGCRPQRAPTPHSARRQASRVPSTERIYQNPMTILEG